MISGSKDFTARLWDLRSMECLWTSVAAQQAVLCVSWDPFDDTVVGICGRDRTAKLLSVETGDCVFDAVGHTGAVVCMQARNNIVISGSDDCTVKIWDRRTPHPTTTVDRMLYYSCVSNACSSFSVHWCFRHGCSRWSSGDGVSRSVFGLRSCKRSIHVHTPFTARKSGLLCPRQSNHNVRCGEYSVCTARTVS